LRSWVEGRLTGVSARMDPAAVADHLAGAPEGATPVPLARIVTATPRAGPVDTGAPDWQARVRTTLAAALRAQFSEPADAHRLGPPTPAHRTAVPPDQGIEGAA